MIFLDQARQTIRANTRQREALSKRGIKLPAPPPPAPVAPSSYHLASMKFWRQSRSVLLNATHQRALKVRQTLQKRFPKCFRKFGKSKQPLKIDITADVIAAAPDINPNDIANAVGDYCSGKSYNAAMIEGANRIDINGDIAGTVTKSAAGHAAYMLKKLKEAPMNSRK